MKRHGNLWHKIIDSENIYQAYLLSKKGKSSYRNVIKFDANRDSNLEQIRQSLINKTFTTSRYQEKIVFEPKMRTIYVLPFAPDRIVQHALMRVIIPIWQPMMIEHSYSCIENRGQHKGSIKTLEFVRRNRYCLKCDVSKFYPSISHDKLMAIIERKIKCPDTLWLMRDIVYSIVGGRNVPIGNFTSQWFGNLYLNELDTYVKHELKIGDYLRYCDDFLLFHNDKSVLNSARRKIEAFIVNELDMRLSKCDLFPTSRGVDFLGYRHFPEGHVLVRKSTAKRIMKRIRSLKDQYQRGYLAADKMRSIVASAQGWLQHANTYNMVSLLRLGELHRYADRECKRVLPQ